MSHVERAVDYVKGRGYARTPELAKHLGLIPGDVDLLLAGQSVFVTCDVQVGESKLKEYRLSTSPAHNFRAGQPVPPTPPGQASAAPTRLAHTPAAPVREAPKEEPMAEKKPVAERVVAALTKHGKLGLDDLAKHAGTTKATLYTMMGSLVKKHGVRRVDGKRGCYEMAGKWDPRQRVALAEGAELGRKKKANGAAPAKAADSLYSAALLDLQEKREAMVEQLAKLDRAIEAVGALA